MTRLLTKEAIQKMAHIIRERHKEAVAAPAISMRVNQGASSSSGVASIAPSVKNPMGLSLPGLSKAKPEGGTSSESKIGP